MWRFPKTISDEKVIFVLGTPRSGTTLLQKILEAHSKLFSIHSETAIFSFQNFWDSKRRLFDMDTKESSMILKKSIDNVDFFQNAVRHLGKSNPGMIFIEKTPQHIKYLDFLIAHFPKAKFVHIVRDGRDCYCSARNHPWIPQSRSLQTFGKFYARCLSQGINAYDHPNVFTIKYEDLVADPKIELSKLMSGLELTLEDAQLDASLRSKDNRANLEQFKKLNGQIDSSSVERWRNELSSKEIEEFNSYAGDQLAFYGYSVD